MELLYSMRRAPLAIDPPYLESLNGGPTLCTLSHGNIAAFTSLTKLSERSGDSWGSHVYVCDINTPWDSSLVASYVHQVSALEWDMEGKYLLVGTTVGDVSIYGAKDYLLNDWLCLYTATFPGEHIIKAAFFHNGRRIVMSADKKSEQLPCTERFQHQRMAPSVRGFGGVACEGGVVITASGMIGAFLLPAEAAAAAAAGVSELALPLTGDSLLNTRSYIVGVACEGGVVITASGMIGAFLLPAEAAAAAAAGVSELALPLTGDSLLNTRSYIVCADICYSNDGKLLVAVCGAGGAGEACVRCYRVSVRRASAPAAHHAPLICTQPLPSFYQRETATRDSPGMCVRALRWCLREDTDTLLVAAECGGAGAGGARGSLVDAWTLTERALPIHSLVAKGPAQGNTTPGGPPKPNSECFNTVEWVHQHRFRSGEGRIVSLSCSKSQLCAGAGSGAPSLPYILVGFSDNTLHLLYHTLTRVCSISVSPAGGGAAEAAAAAAAAGAGGATPPKIPKYGSIPSGVESATISSCEVSRLGAVMLCVDTHSQLHLYKLPQPATDIPTPLSIQHATSLLEYALVTGYDYIDVLMTLKPTTIEAIYERISESFQRQPATFQQYHYVSWLCLRAALCRLLPEGQTRASDLTCLLMLHSISNAFKSLLRPAELTSHDKGPAESLAALIQDDSAGPAPADIHKVLVVLEAKDFTAEPLALQSLRRLIQRVADTALAALAALPARHAHKPLAHNPHSYELCSDPTALNLMRELLVISRVWGLLRQQALPTFTRAPEGSDVLAALYRLLTRLAAPHAQHPPPPPLDPLLEECSMLPSQVLIPRVWESPPRCCVAAPHAQHYPLYLEYGTEPEALKYNPDVPALEGSTADTDMDSIRYIHLGVRAARVRRCSRCGARALAAAYCARTHAQRAWDMRWLPTCRCGGRWTLQTNT